MTTKYFYSPAQNLLLSEQDKSWYDARGAWPDDARGITEKVFSEFSGTPPEGKKLSAENGSPAWADITPPVKYFFSPSLNLLYCDINRSAYETAGSWPEDAREITRAVFTEFAGTPPTDKVRSADPDRVPVWADMPQPEHAELVARADAQKTARIADASAYINTQQWPGKAALGRLSDADKKQYVKWLDYLDALTAIDTTEAPDINWPEIPA